MTQMITILRHPQILERLTELQQPLRTTTKCHLVPTMKLQHQKKILQKFKKIQLRRRLQQKHIHPMRKYHKMFQTFRRRFLRQQFLILRQRKKMIQILPRKIRIVRKRIVLFPTPKTEILKPLKEKMNRYKEKHKTQIQTQPFPKRVMKVMRTQLTTTRTRFIKVKDGEKHKNFTKETFNII